MSDIDLKSSELPCFINGIAGTEKEEACWEMIPVCDQNTLGTHTFVTEDGSFVTTDYRSCRRMLQKLSLLGYRLRWPYATGPANESYYLGSGRPRSYEHISQYAPPIHRHCFCNKSWPASIYFEDGTNLEQADRTACLHEAAALSELDIPVDIERMSLMNGETSLCVVRTEEFDFPYELTGYLGSEIPAHVRRLMAKFGTTSLEQALKKALSKLKPFNRDAARLLATSFLKKLAIFTEKMHSRQEMHGFARSLSARLRRQPEISYDILRAVSESVGGIKDFKAVLSRLSFHLDHVEPGDEASFVEVLERVGIRQASDLKVRTIKLFEKATGSRALDSIPSLVTKRLYSEALDALSPIGGMDSSDWQSVLAILVQLIESVDTLVSTIGPGKSIPEDKSFMWGESHVRDREEIRKKLIERIDLFLTVRSPVEFRLTLLRNALEHESFSFRLKTVERKGGVIIKRFGKLDGLSLVYLEGSKAPGVVPGDATISNGNLIVRGYNGWPGLTVVFKGPRTTLVGSNEAFMSIQSVLPESFFHRVRRTIFSDKNEGKAGGTYGGNEVWINSSDGTPVKNTIIHEFAHHWDISNTMGYDRCENGFGDASTIFRQISWEGIDEKMYVHGRNSKKMERHDFDREDFVTRYSMTNPSEDIAETAEEYVMKGCDFRKRAREQMKTRNFELALKYLYVKHVMPFQGKEYGPMKGDGFSPLTLDEVRKSIRRAGAPKDRGAYLARAERILDRIEEIQTRKMGIRTWR